MPSGYGGKRIFRDLSRNGISTRDLATFSRNFLGVTIEQQFSFSSPEQAFKTWRHAIEQAGVFAFKGPLKDKFVSGFSLLDKYYPAIFVNNSNSFTRQTFTLAHELGHILWAVNGVTDVDETYIQFMDVEERELEIECNKFAAELLIPEDTFVAEIDSFDVRQIDAVLDTLSDKFSVSRESILRRLLDFGFVDVSLYQQKKARWDEEYIRTYGGGSRGGNYYLTRLAYLGEGFARLAFDRYRQGRLTKADIAQHLNVKARNIDKLEQYLGW